MPAVLPRSSCRRGQRHGVLPASRGAAGLVLCLATAAYAPGVGQLPDGDLRYVHAEHLDRTWLTTCAAGAPAGYQGTLSPRGPAPPASGVRGRLVDLQARGRCTYVRGPLLASLRCRHGGLEEVAMYHRWGSSTAAGPCSLMGGDAA